MITQETFQGNWDGIKVKLRGRWGSLTDDDLFNGNVDQLVETIQRKTGEPRTGQQLSSDGAAVFRGDSNTGQAGVQQATESAWKTSQKVGTSVREGDAEVEGMVRRRPTKALALCFAAGVMSGVVILLLRRR